MSLSIERLNRVIKLDSPTGLRKLLSEYIRLCGQVEIQRSHFLDIKLAIINILRSDAASLPANIHLQKISSVKSKTRSRSFSAAKTGIKTSLDPLLPHELKKLSMRRSRSHSAKAANI